MHVTYHSDSSVSVWHIPTHSGHDNRKDPVSVFPIPENIKENVRQKGLIGIPVERIIRGQSNARTVDKEITSIN